MSREKHEQLFAGQLLSRLIVEYTTEKNFEVKIKLYRYFKFACDRENSPILI